MNSTVNLQKINEAMNCISFSNVLLDAALIEINSQLVFALGGASVAENLEDQDLNRASAGSAMALVGVLSGLKDTNGATNLEALMIGVDFLDEDDLIEAKIVKGVMLDCLMAQKVSDTNESELVEVKSLRSKVAEILQRHGYAGHYFTASTGSSN